MRSAYDQPQVCVLDFWISRWHPSSCCLLPPSRPTGRPTSRPVGQRGNCDARHTPPAVAQLPSAGARPIGTCRDILAATVAAALAVAIVAPATATARPYGFLATPTDQLAVPGHESGFEITPEGFIYGGYGELVLRAGPQLVGLRAPVRALHGGRYPLMRYGQKFAGVRYEVQAFASIVAAQPVALLRVTIRNETPRPAQARWAVGMAYSLGALKPSGVRRFRFPRPAVPQLPGLYTQAGVPFDPGWAYTFGPRAILRDGNIMATVAPPAAGVVVEPLRREGSGAVLPSTAFGLVRYRIALAPGATRRLDFAMPSRPVPEGTPQAAELRAAPFAAHRDAMLRGVAARVRAGDVAVAARAPRPGRVLREPHAHPAAALPAARPRLGAARQQAALPRLLAARRGDHDAGARPRGPAPPRRREPRVLRALAARRRPVHLARRPARRPRAGDVGDRRARAAQPRPPVRADRVAVAAARRRVAGARAPPRPAGARAAVGPARQRARRRPPRGRRLLGGGRSGGGDRRRADARRGRARGRLGGRARRRCARPCARASRRRRRATAARSRPRSTTTAAWTGATCGPRGRRRRSTRCRRSSRARSRRRAVAFARASRRTGRFTTCITTSASASGRPSCCATSRHASCRGCTTRWRTRRTPVVASRPACGRTRGARSTTTSRRTAGSPPSSSRCCATCSCASVDGGLELLSAVPGRWLEPGRATVVRNASTLVGAVDVSLRPVRGGAILGWNAAQAPPGTPLWWRVPAAARDVRAPGLAPGARVLALPGRAGRLRIHWRLPRRSSSFDGVTAALIKSYRQRKLTPPG